MNRERKVSCILCHLSEESHITGALSTKESVTAHQNCLLYSSGIICKHSPEFDDLFGFSVKDVLDEVKRGSKLTCSKCKKKGATIGCEVRRCQKSYHYPCAVEAKAEPIEDEVKEKYVLYCFKHSEQLQRIQSNGSVDGLGSSFPRPSTSRDCNKAGPSKRNANDDTTAAGASSYSSDSNSSNSATCGSSKRRKSISDEQEAVPSKRKSGGCKRRIPDDSSNSDENEINTEMAIFAPLESDLDDSANSVQEHQLIRKNNETPTGSTSGNQMESRDENKDEDETIIYSDAESESVLPAEICKEPQSPPATSAEPSSPTTSFAHLKVISVRAEDEDLGCSPEQRSVQSPDQHNTGPSVPQQSSTGPAPSPAPSKSCSDTGSPPRNCRAIFPPSSPVVHPPESSIDSVSFWKSCNAAGCTQAIFADFIHEMNEISSRIQSDQASQEDYDLALKVIKDSGKLTQLVTKQQKELQRKQTELKKAAAAMKQVISALKR